MNVLNALALFYARREKNEEKVRVDLLCVRCSLSSHHHYHQVYSHM